MAGAGTALELASHGQRVTLIDQDELPVNRASLRNEGKIHLGFVYANDRTLATARLQIEGALTFRSILSAWVGAEASSLRLSTPFVYVVAHDSLLSVDELSAHYDAVDSLYREHLRRHPSHDYLGRQPAHLFAPCPLAEIESFVDTERLSGAFRTAELAIDPEQVAGLLRAAVTRSAGIRFLPGHKVKTVERVNGRFSIEGVHAEGSWHLEAGQVVNALWDNRLLIDNSVGLPSIPGWVHRLKFRVIGRIAPELLHAPSVTMVLGPYGDVVIRPDRTAYFSWYPLGLRGWTHDVAPPDDWNPACRGEISSEEAAAMAKDLLAAIGAWYRGAAESTPLAVDAGAIFAYGHTDVDDTASGLHDRARAGVITVDGYHSVDPGKLTTAPLFARMAAHRVLEGRIGA